MTYEIEGIKRGNGVLGVFIHTIKDQNGESSRKGDLPEGLSAGGFHCYSWDKKTLGRLIQRAAIQADKACLEHDTKQCWIVICQFG